MWMWTEQEKHEKFLKIAQKWMEWGSGVEELSKDVVEKAFRKSQETSKGIIQKLDIKTPETSGFIGSWVELGLFVGYIAGWKDSCNILPRKPLSATLYSGGFDTYTKVDWATPWAARYAFTATEQVFSNMLTPPVSPLIQGFTTREIDILRETYERSLLVGYLQGLEAAAGQESIFSDLGKISSLNM